MLRNWRSLFCIAVLALVGCQGNSAAPPTPNVSIHGRNSAPLYRIFLPSDWNVVQPQHPEYQSDTRLPLIEFKQGSIKIAIHNFPGIPIPPEAQINRWKQQLGSLSSATNEILPLAWSGYEGFMLSAPGVRAWAMELASEHERILLWDSESTIEKRAPFTIKITGSESELQAQCEAIERIVYSFEQIEPIESGA